MTMFHTINARNINHALIDGLWWIYLVGKTSTSRNGPVIVAPGSVMTIYEHPQERVLFHHLRDCNHYFHFFEALWMLSGQRTVTFLEQFNPRMRDFVDHAAHGAVNLHGAYGHRWRHMGPHDGHGIDQLRRLISMLKHDPTTRRAVLSMWSTELDLDYDSKDLPCNTHCYFDRRGEGQPLNMLICCRSNDAIWGAYGANAVHFSYLLEYLAAAIGCDIGMMYQLSFNLHIYPELEVTKRLTNEALLMIDYAYELQKVEPYPLLQKDETIQSWDADLEHFMSDPGGDTAYTCKFFGQVAAPLYTSWQEYKANNLLLAQTTLESVQALDWRKACHEWLQRRIDKRAERSG